MVSQRMIWYLITCSRLLVQISSLLQLPILLAGWCFLLWYCPMGDPHWWGALCPYALWSNHRCVYSLSLSLSFSTRNSFCASKICYWKLLSVGETGIWIQVIVQLFVFPCLYVPWRKLYFTGIRILFPSLEEKIFLSHV